MSAADRTDAVADETTIPDLPPIGGRERYDALMAVVRNRVTSRAFDPGFEVPRKHYELILEAARHAPSGANTQPWHYCELLPLRARLPRPDGEPDHQRRPGYQPRHPSDHVQAAGDDRMGVSRASRI